jgi:methionyl aminopeptidase
MIICLEPMLMTESDKYIVDPVNKWTIKAQNKKLTCHNEHMVLVTKNGYEILTND